MFGHVSENVVNEPTRRRLSTRQADTVRRLATAGLEELRHSGYGGLTVRKVAARAGVTPATAYTYFSSKNHLVAELFWRRLQALPATVEGADRTERVVHVLRETSLLVSDEPDLAAACTTAILGDDPDVQHLRLRIGTEIRHRLSAALGDEDDPTLIHALEFAWSGAMVRAGMGYASYDRVAQLLTETAELIMGRAS